jgi:hypothetical protein
MNTFGGTMDAYRVEIEDQPCSHCTRGTLFAVLGPDEIALGVTFEDKGEAQELADYMNLAYNAGLMATQPQARHMNIPPMPALFLLYDDDGVPSGVSVTDIENWGNDGWSYAKRLEADLGVALKNNAAELLNAMSDEAERCRAAITNWIELHEVDHLTGPELDAAIRRALEPMSNTQ